MTFAIRYEKYYWSAKRSICWGNGQSASNCVEIGYIYHYSSPVVGNGSCRNAGLVLHGLVEPSDDNTQFNGMDHEDNISVRNCHNEIVDENVDM